MPPEETISSTKSTGRPANRAVGERNFDRAIAAARLLRHRVIQAQPAREIAHPGPGFLVGADYHGCRIECRCAQRVAIAGMADRLSASMPGKTPECRGAMQVRLDCHDTVKGSRKHLADDALADRFAGMECGVLAHIGEIGRYQHQPSGAFAS